MKSLERYIALFFVLTTITLSWCLYKEHVKLTDAKSEIIKLRQNLCDGKYCDVQEDINVIMSLEDQADFIRIYELLDLEGIYNDNPTQEQINLQKVDSILGKHLHP